MTNKIKAFDPIKELSEFGLRPLLEDLASCGDTPEEAWADKTPVQINAPRALMMVAFGAQVQLLVRLKKEGMLANFTCPIPGQVKT